MYSNGMSHITGSYTSPVLVMALPAMSMFGEIRGLVVRTEGIKHSEPELGNQCRSQCSRLYIE